MKTLQVERNASENSYSASFSFGTHTVSTGSQSPLTTQTEDTLGEILSSDSSQRVTEDDLLDLLDSTPWSLEDRDSINRANKFGQNLAHLCTQLGYHRLLTAVIERGADIHARDINGWTPLDFARLHRDEDAIDILEGEWEDYIQDIISTGSLPIDLLHRFIPGCVLAIQTTKSLAELV